MAYGLGQGTWAFASPDFPAGGAAYASVAGDGVESAFTAGPYVGGDPNTAEGAGVAHVSTGTGTDTANPGARASHWSNLLDWKHGPLFWLALATILYFGLVSVRVGARVGSVRVGGGTGH